MVMISHITFTSKKNIISYFNIRSRSNMIEFTKRYIVTNNNLRIYNLPIILTNCF